MKRSIPLLLAALLPVFAAAAGYKSMWITDVRTGRTVGPVVNKPGNRFSAGGRQWVVLQAGRGEVDFADAATMKAQGPYGLVEQRMFELGEDAYVFTRVSDYEGATPGADEAVVSQAERAPAEKGRHPWSGDLPERWVLAPLPSTNPGDHKEPGKSWHLETLQVAPEAVVWFEPVHEIPHDWSLGGFAGSADAKLRSRRYGVSGAWRGLFAEAGLVADVEGSGSLVPDGLSLASLKLDGGDGFHVAGGYEYAFVIDGGWSANFSAFAVWDRLDVDLSATTTKETDIIVETDGDGGSSGDGGDSGGGSGDTGSSGSGTTTAKGYTFEKWSAGSTLEEIRLGVGVGLRYDEWYWGLGAKVLVDCWTDATLDVKVPVLSKDYELEAERARPVGIRVDAWYCPAGSWILEGSVTVSSETSLRLGTGFFF